MKYFWEEKKTYFPWQKNAVYTPRKFNKWKLICFNPVSGIFFLLILVEYIIPSGKFLINEKYFSCKVKSVVEQPFGMDTVLHTKCPTYLP
jgi:hypothetical protein